MGCWLSKDKIGISGGLNQYVFCGNNPVNFVDPLGELYFDWDGFIGSEAPWTCLLALTGLAGGPIGISATIHGIGLTLSPYIHLGNPPDDDPPPDDPPGNDDDIT